MQLRQLPGPPKCFYLKASRFRVLLNLRCGRPPRYDVFCTSQSLRYSLPLFGSSPQMLGPQYAIDQILRLKDVYEHSRATAP